MGMQFSVMNKRADGFVWGKDLKLQRKSIKVSVSFSNGNLAGLARSI